MSGRPGAWNHSLSRILRWLGGTPCFQVYGKGRAEASWRVVNVHATHRRDRHSSWPALGWRGTCTTWSHQVVAVGWDFAEDVLREQLIQPATREQPVVVGGARLRLADIRLAAGSFAFPSASEILAHEIGHTWQALRLGVGYLPLVGPLTLFREGPRWMNHFENQASAEGMFGGILEESISLALAERIQSRE